MSHCRVALLVLFSLTFLLILCEHAKPQAGPAKPVASEVPPPDVDAFGDPLPPGASARLGSLRLWASKLITAMAFAPDGRNLATASEDGKVYVWESSTGKKLRQLQGPKGEIGAVVFSRDGKTLSAAARAGGTLWTWDTATGKELRKVLGREADDCVVAFSDNGNIVAAGNAAKESTILLRETAAGKDFLELKGHRGVIYAVALSPTGKLLASGGDDKTLRLWDLTSGKEIRALGSHAQRIRCVCFSRDGKLAASASDDGTVRIWNVAAGKELHQLAAHSQPVTTLAFSPDGKVLVSGGRNRRLCLWDVATGKVVRQVQGHFSALVSTAFSPDGKILASAGTDGRVRLWDMTTAQQQLRHGHQAAVHALAYSPDGRTLISAGFDNSIRFWDPATSRELRHFEVVPEGVTSMALSPDGAIIASAARATGAGDKNPGIRLWDSATGKEIRRLKGHPKGVFCLAFSPSGKILASGGEAEQDVRLWDVARGWQLRRFQAAQKGGIRGMVFSPDGKALAAGSTDHMVRLWEVASGRVRSEVSPMDLSDHVFAFGSVIIDLEDKRVPFSREPAPPLVESILFFPDGKTLGSAGSNDGGGSRFGNRRRLFSIWDTSASRELRWFAGPEPRPLTLAAALSPDGRILALGSDQGAVQLKDAITGQELRLFRGHQGPVYALAFSPDGNALASSSDDATILIWDVAAALRATPLPAEEALNKELQAAWIALADADAAAAARVMWKMTETPQATVWFLAAHLQPIAPVDRKKIEQWIADLGHARYRVRQEATDALRKLDQALPDLHQALEGNPSLELRRRVEQILEKLEQSPAPGHVRALRALEILEHIGSAEACALLATLSQGAPGARLTQAAQEAQQRLARRRDGAR
jgi:WD40 repeat protein